MSRSLRQQFGMDALENMPRHFVDNGVRMTRYIDSKGYITSHRRIGNPYPLFAIALGAAFVMLGALNLNVRGLQGTAIWLTVALPLGGLASMTTMMISFILGNSYLSTASGTLAGLIGGISLIFLPATGITKAYFIAAGGDKVQGALLLYKALSIVFFASFIPCFILFMAALKQALPVALSTAILSSTLLLTAVAYTNYPQVAIQHAAGYLCMLAGGLSLSSALAVLLTEEGIDIMPVMPLPDLD